MHNKKVSAFIGSSKEGLGIAQAIQLELEEYATCTIWYQGVFGLNEGTLESLEKSLEKFEFAILVLTPDDVVISREKVVQLPRDNVLFELGLFMGRLGRKRVFIVYCDEENIKLPSDLAGVTVCRISKLDENKELNKYSITELLPKIGPAVSKIRSEIYEVQKSQPKQVEIYYIAPTLSHNEYYSRLQTIIEAELSKVKNTTWHFCPPQGETPYDIFMELENILSIIKQNDIVILVPKNLSNPRIKKLFQEIIKKCPSGKLIFIDQQPPVDLLNDSSNRISFVGIDNLKVGISAAFALYDRMSKMPDRLYCAIEGPGGEMRIKGFIDGIKFFDPDNEVEVFTIGDVDRFESLPYISQIIKSCPSETSLGIFAGNDETALAVIRSVENSEQNNVFVVGCDATREMRSLVESKNSAAIATIDTGLLSQAKKIVQIIQTGGIEFQEPKLYPLNLRFRKLLRDQKFKEIWDSGK